MLQDFVDDWLIYDSILGEGAYGEVRLIVNRNTDEKVACKIIDTQQHKGSLDSIKRETAVHCLLNHENIIKYLGKRKEKFKIYLFLEYASGGELFQQIDPGVGMPTKDVQFYMKQLIEGVRYLHSRGVTHRDIKPENILLTDNRVLKISDFGLATIFRYKGKERLLDKKCGTKPYLAHEILLGRYRAEPADTWSCGIVLVAMLVGELLWTCPSEDYPEFSRYKHGNYLTQSPWNRLGNASLSLVKSMLEMSPNKRIELEKVQSHPWMTLDFSGTSMTTATNTNEYKADIRRASMMEFERQHGETPHVALSQPIFTSSSYLSIHSLVSDEAKRFKRDNNVAGVCFSQPIHNDDLILSSQIQFTQTPITKDNFHHLIKRMTRFYVVTSWDETLEKLCAVLDALLFNWNIDASGSITISAVDSLKNQLVFKVASIKMEKKILLDFRLSKGCGLEFKKKFVKIKKCLENIVATDDD